MKIHWSIRTIAFIASVFTLSIFFAGWRELSESGHIAYGAFVMSAGILLTGLLLALQGYWIYFEEKEKGTLRRHVRAFEALHLFLEARVQKGNNKQ
jgi:hypothetical protein